MLNLNIEWLKCILEFFFVASDRQTINNVLPQQQESSAFLGFS